MKRNFDQKLLDWKLDPRRRVLLVRGARQVGKTYSVRVLGRAFTNCPCICRSSFLFLNACRKRFKDYKIKGSLRGLAFIT